MLFDWYTCCVVLLVHMLCCFTGTHVVLFDWYTCCVVLLVRMLCCLTGTQVVL